MKNRDTFNRWNLVLNFPSRSVYAIRELRTERDITQEALAHGAGITVGHLSKIERGLANPGWSTVEAIAEALGVRMAEVVQRVEKYG